MICFLRGPPVRFLGALFGSVGDLVSYYLGTTALRAKTIHDTYPNACPLKEVPPPPLLFFFYISSCS